MDFFTHQTVEKIENKIIIDVFQLNFCVYIWLEKKLWVLLKVCKCFLHKIWNELNCCSDFRYESNGIFVLGVGFFFLQTNFDFLTSHFRRNFFISFKLYCCLELKCEKIFHLWSFFVKLWGFKSCHFGHFDQFGTFNARYNLSY